MSEKPILTRTFRADMEVKSGRVLEGCCVPYGEAAKVRDTPTGPVYYEMFDTGCFRKQLKAPERLELRYEHSGDLAHSIGVCRELHEQTSGLIGVFAVHQGAFGDQALELVRSGILPGFSIGFQDQFTHPKQTAEGTVVRQNCRLFEVSLTRTPAYQGAQVLAMRSRAELSAEWKIPGVDEEQIERLRRLGISV